MRVRGLGPALAALSMLVGWVLSSGPAAAAPLPAPPPIAAGPGVPSELAALRMAVLPKPVGIPFFDDWPADLDRYRPGQVIATRDVTATAAPALFLPVRRVTQLKFRSTDAHGMPSFGTATLVVPAAAWTGPGSRPIVVNNQQIDSLGRDCTPGVTVAKGLSMSTDLTTWLAESRGYAVLLPDHEGPRMAYAEPRVAGHIVLDSIRAVRSQLPDQFGAARIALAGYSGGAIAALAASRLVASYAPELSGVLAGSMIGGVPADFRMLSATMNGTLASGLYLAAVLGVAREHPELLTGLSGLGRWAAGSPLKDMCGSLLEAAGVAELPVELAAAMAHPLQSPLAVRAYAETSMAGMKSEVPLYIYNGEQEWWVPAAGARAVYREQCLLGARAVYRAVPGEHFIASLLGYPDAITWLDQRLHGVPAPTECPTTPR